MRYQLTIVINTASLRREIYIKHLLNALSNQEKQNFIVFIVFPSNTQLREMLKNLIYKYRKQYPIKLIEDVSCGGLARGRNLGLILSQTPYIAFIDDDAIPSKGWTKYIVEDLSRYDGVIGPVIPLIIKNSCKNLPNEVLWVFSCTYIQPEYEQVFGYRGFGANMAFKRDILLKLGGFNTKLGENKRRRRWIGGDDTELFYRFRHYGYSLFFDPRLKVYHIIDCNRCTIKSILTRAYNVGMSNAILIKKFKYTYDRHYRKYYIKYFTSQVLKRMISFDTTFLWSIAVISAFSLGYLRFLTKDYESINSFR